MAKKKKRKLKVWRVISAIIFVVLGLTSIGLGIYGVEIFKKQEEKIIYPDIPKPQVTETNASMVMVGDSLIHSAVYQKAKKGNTYDFSPMFTEVKDIIKQNDLAFYNQETILGGKELGLSSYPQFNSPYEVGDAFIDMGFNLVSLATNHTLDRGYGTKYKTIANSRAYWNKQEGIIAAGSYTSQEEKDEVIVQEKNGIKYGLLAYTTLTNGLVRPNGKEYYLDVYNAELAKKDIEKLRDKVDLLVVSMHWGIEYSHGISQEQKTIAKYLADLGVDIVVGHHPHVVEPIEWIDDTLVIYSLGNFISSQIGIERLTGLMTQIKITKTVIDDKTYIKLSDLKADLIYTCKPAVCGNYKVYPYNELSNKILNGYKNYYKKYMDIVKKIEKDIEPIYSSDL